MRVRDKVPTGAPAPDAHLEQPNGDLFSAVDGECPPDAAVVVKCIMLRAAFGGMAGDVEMLTGFAPAWQSRYAVGVPSCHLQLCVSTALWPGPTLCKCFRQVCWSMRSAS